MYSKYLLKFPARSSRRRRTERKKDISATQICGKYKKGQVKIKITDEMFLSENLIKVKKIC